MRTPDGMDGLRYSGLRAVDATGKSLPAPDVQGCDVWGHNYQVHMFNGYDCEAYRDAAWCQPYKIGSVIWGAFAIIQQVENDPCAGIHGLQYSSPDHNGFGGW